MTASKLTPAQRTERARIAANTRWSRETDRLAATAPGLRAAFAKLLDEVDPQHRLSENQRHKLAKNAQQAQLARARLLASKKRQATRPVVPRDHPRADGRAVPERVRLAGNTLVV